MSDRPSGPEQCFNCGRETDDWDYIGTVPQWVCSAAACHREMRDENRGLTEQAALDAAKDDYERYR